MGDCFQKEHRPAVFRSLTKSFLMTQKNLSQFGQNMSEKERWQKVFELFRTNDGILL